jgi:protein-L-isoaspartate(D-aspartate) O-methyltransferase
MTGQKRMRFFAAKVCTTFVGCVILASAFWLLFCSRQAESRVAQAIEAGMNSFEKERNRMVDTQIAAMGVTDTNVLAAMRKVPRHLFVEDKLQDVAYIDSPLRIDGGQTISQPYIVAKMTELAHLTAPCKVLEVGTGSGYQAAILAELGCRVYSIEIIPELSQKAGKILSQLGYANVTLIVGDGYGGLPEQAPFDAIVVTAAAPAVPDPLKRQLAMGGRLVIPVGRAFQELMLITRTGDGFKNQDIFGVVFVPMVGKAQQ